MLEHSLLLKDIFPMCSLYQNLVAVERKTHLNIRILKLYRKLKLINPFANERTLAFLGQLFKTNDVVS